MPEQTPAAPPAPAQAKPSDIRVSPASLKSSPTPAAAPPVAVEAPKPAPQDDVAPRLAELDKAHARLAAERRKAAEERKSAKAELDELARYRTEKAEAKRNPDKFLKSIYGDNYYDALTRLKVDGAPPADLIASEMDERFKSVEKQLEEKAAALEKRFQDAQVAEAQRAKNEYLANAVAHAKANPEKYKLLKALEAHGIYDSIPAKIEAHFRATAKQDANGNWLPGKTLTPEAAALEVEEEVSKIAESFRGYFEAETKAKQPAAPQRQVSTQRSAETPANGEWAPPKSEKERLARAFAAADAHLAGRQQH